MKQTKKHPCRAALAGVFCTTVLASALPALPASAATATLIGDVTLDGSVGITDVVAEQQYLLNNRSLSASAFANADYNADGKVNVLDLILLKRAILNPVTDGITIHLSDSGIKVEGDSKGVTSISGKTVTITASGTYQVDGSITDGQILINVPDTTADADDVELVLNGVTMTSTTGAPCINTVSAAKTKLTVTGTNTLVDSATTANAETSGVIYADSKLTVTKNSTGVLNITSAQNTGIYASKNLNLNGGTIVVDTDSDDAADADAIKTKKTLTVEGATVTVTSSADGLKSTKEEVDVVSGSVTIKAGNDAVQASTAINISGGTVVASGDRGFTLDDAGALYITGGTVLATATDNQIADTTDFSGSTQGVMLLDFAAEQKKGQAITILQNGSTVYEMTPSKKFSYAIVSGSGISSGTYTAALNGATLTHLPSGSSTQDGNFTMSSNTTEFYNVTTDGSSSSTTTTSGTVATISYSGSTVKLLDASGNTVSSADGVTVSGTSVTITQPMTVDVIGDSTAARIEVNVDKTAYPDGVVELDLKGANLSNSTAAPIYVASIGDEVVISSKSGTVNTIADGSSHTDTYVDSDGNTNTINAAIFARDDLKLKGAGSLTVTGNTEDGIVCKNDLKVYNGTITVNAVDDGIRGKDSVTIGNASNTDFSDLNVTVATNGDGIKASNDDEAGEGTVTINGGTISLNVLYDGIQAVSDVTVNGGTLDIYTFDGHTYTGTSGSSSSGNHSGGFGGGGFNDSDGNANKVENSAKGIKSDGTLNILGGTINIDSSDDALHCAGNLNLFGGTMTLASADDAVHSDATLTIGNNSNTFDDVKVYASYCYEGIEGYDIIQNSGTVVINSADDSYNASCGDDDGNMGGGGWSGNSGSSHGSTHTLQIKGGIALANAEDGDHDGFDSNGTLTISGGYAISNGSDTFDSDNTMSYTGGVFVAEGSVSMTTTVSASGANASAGTRITLADTSGNVIVSFIADKSVSTLNAGCSDSSAVFYTGGTISGGTLLTEGFGTQSIYVDGTISGGTQLSSSGGGNSGWGGNSGGFGGNGGR